MSFGLYIYSTVYVLYGIVGNWADTREFANAADT